jgi:hypothetical protein
MTEMVADDRLVLSDPNATGGSNVWHAASPFMIGLVGGVLVMVFVAPGVLRQAHFIMGTLLLPVLFVAIGIYAWSVLNPGEIVGLVADRTTRTVEVQHSNAFTSRRSVIPFGEIARIASEQSYDRDGYGGRVTVISLASGSRLVLGFGVSEEQIMDMRAMLGHRA